MKNLIKQSKFKVGLLGVATLALSLWNSSAFSGEGRFKDYARVTRVTPIYETVRHEVPERECWVEQVREEVPTRRRNSATPAILGGIVGGALGNAVGAGSENKKVGVVVGSLLGMSVGGDIARHHNRHHDRGHSEVRYRDVERCEVRHRVETERELVGYNVRYKYRGQAYSTRMDHHPGKRIRVAVDVRPARH